VPGWQWANQQSLQKKQGQIGEENLSAAQMYADINSNTSDAPCVAAAWRKTGWAGRGASWVRMCLR